MSGTKECCSKCGRSDCELTDAREVVEWTWGPIQWLCPIHLAELKVQTGAIKVPGPSTES